MTAGIRKITPLNILPQYTCPNPGKKNEPAAHKYGSLSLTVKVSPSILLSRSFFLKSLVEGVCMYD